MKLGDASVAVRSPHLLATAMSTLVVATGVSVQLGWHLHAVRLTQWVPGAYPAAYNTAISLAILGAALLGITQGRRRLPAGLAALCGLLSLLTLFEYVAGISLGIDALLMKAGGPAEFPGRIAPNACLCQFLLSAATLCMLRKNRYLTFISPLLISLALGLSSVSLAGYLTGFSTYGWGRLVPMAVPTAVGLMLFSIGALSILWQDTDRSTAGSPSWLYITATVASMVMAVSLWQAQASEEHVLIERLVGAQTEIVRANLLADTISRIGAVERLAHHWEITGPPDSQELAHEAAMLEKDVHGFLAIGWLDPAFRVRLFYPQKGAEAALGVDLNDDVRRRVRDTARDLQRTIFTRTIQSSAGDGGITTFIPVYRDSVLLGFIAAGFHFRDLIPIAMDNLAPGYSLGIYDGTDEVYFRGREDARREGAWEHHAILQFANSRWTLKFWPAPADLAQESTTSKILLAGGILLSILLGWAVHLSQAAHMRRGLAEQARAALENEIKERHRAEQELDQFFGLVPDMLCIAGFDGYFKRVNPAWENTLGIPLDRLLREPFANYLHPDDQKETRRAFHDLQGCACLRSFENRYRALDGSYHWLKWNSLPLPERQLVFASARDVTAEKLAAEELQRAHHDLEQRIRERTADLEIANRDLYERKELFRRLFEDSPIGTALIAVDQRLTKVNGALCGLLGYGASELLGLTLEDITYHDDMQKGVDLMSKTIGGLIPGYRLTKRYLRKDREIVWVDVNVTILRDQLGTPITVLAKVENVNDRLRHDEEITRLNQELQSRVDELTVVNQELESFNYSVSHDLRAPLRHMDGFSTILLEECRMQIPASSRKYLELISEGARRMGRMVDELLELSRTSRKELVKQPTGLKSLVDDVLKELRSELNQRAVEFRIGNLPFVDCDPGLARQVFANLLSNALKFTGPRKRALIEVGQTWREGQLVVFVRDNGVGFNMKYAGKLFGVFHRLHRREDFEGTGAGLATVQRIIQKHGGRIWAEAELEKGATFFFTLGPPQEEETESEEQNTEVLAGAT